ncbi:unnamed protein product, partial [Staurois parvus]
FPLHQINVTAEKLGPFAHLVVSIIGQGVGVHKELIGNGQGQTDRLETRALPEGPG